MSKTAVSAQIGNKTGKPFALSINKIRFDEHYQPADSTRLTTNFANLARGEARQDNLRKALTMINNRFNALAHWDNPTADRYTVEVDIVSVNLDVAGDGNAFPIIETLQTTIVDHKAVDHKRTRIAGMVGNSLSSYVRDYDFSIVLPAHLDNQKNQADQSDTSHQTTIPTPKGFGELHGKLFQYLVNSEVYQAHFAKPPVICLSVSSNKTYQRTTNRHSILGVEYRQDEYSLTDAYFHKMGLTVRYFMPEGSVAPLAFYFAGDLLHDYTDMELISAISTMETFQKIYRPEIYNANSTAGAVYQPSLNYQDYSLTQVVYDRVERSQMAVTQGRFAEAQFIKPYQSLLEDWVANYEPSSTQVQKKAQKFDAQGSVSPPLNAQDSDAHNTFTHKYATA